MTFKIVYFFPLAVQPFNPFETSVDFDGVFIKVLLFMIIYHQKAGFFCQEGRERFEFE